MASHKFDDLIESLISDLITCTASYEAAISKFEHIPKKSFEKMFDEGNFAKYRSTITAMSVNSTHVYYDFARLEAVCNFVLTEANKNYKDAAIIEDIKKKISRARKLNLAFAQKLPLSIGHGFKPGHYSRGRQLVNKLGDIIIWPILRGDKKKAVYNKSLKDIKELVDGHQKLLDSKEEQGDLFMGHTKIHASFLDVKESIKDLRIFMRIFRQVGRAYRKLQRDVKSDVKRLSKIYYIDQSDLEAFPIIRDLWSDWSDRNED